MYILGINISHHASVCLLKNGHVVYHIEEERLNKRKYWGPNETDHYYKSITALTQFTKRIDRVVFAGVGEPFEMDVIQSIHDQLFSLGLIGEQANHHYAPTQHHLYHAACAFYNSGFKDAAALIVDGGGAKIRDGVNEGESIYRCSYPHKIEGEWQHRFNFYQIEEAFEFKNADGELFSSHITAGSLFNNFGDKLGFNGGFDAGKLMGLASYGTIVDDESWYMNFEGVQMTKNSVIIDRLKADYPTFEDRANLAKKLQVETAKHTRHLIKKCLEISPRVVLSGGYFLNCVNNYEYLDLFDDPSNLYIEPNSSDAGTALGIAKLFHYALSQKKTPIPLKTLYMG